MGVLFVPSAGGGGVKSVQRGTAAGAGNVTITAVNAAKTLVMSYSRGSTGSVAARGTATGTWQAKTFDATTPTTTGENYVNSPLSLTLAAGGTDLTTKTFGARLVNSTTINCDGACEWQVIEFS